MLTMKYCLLALWLLCGGLCAQRAEPRVEVLQLRDGEKWWGGRIADSPQMPFATGYTADLEDNKGNQVQPLLLSNQGRYVWCEAPFKIAVSDSTLVVTSRGEPIQHGQFGRSLADMYRFAAENLFPFQGKMPDDLLFTQPQYNTWIELIYNQNQRDILAYARQIIANGFPPGVLMIDDNWQQNYGHWNFRPDRFPDPKGMVEELHRMGFKVMLWICPFVHREQAIFDYLDTEIDAFVKDPNVPTQAAMVRWWNGESALLDLSYPPAMNWFKGELNRLQTTYGIDGFKLDAGDAPFYDWTVPHDKQVTPAQQSEIFASVGLDYPLNEYRACFKQGGQALVQRLRDKTFSWEDLRTLVPGMTMMGLMGYPFACPDMIGGGEYKSFQALDEIDQELIVRSAQVHALMPMMQFSLAPWRVLDDTHLAATLKAAKLHATFGPTVLQLAKEAATSGAPIVRSLEYAYPEQPYELIQDQFLLGQDYLVAPVITKLARRRKVVIPPGKWVYRHTGVTYSGPTEIEVPAPLDVLPFFRKLE